MMRMTSIAVQLLGRAMIEPEQRRLNDLVGCLAVRETLRILIEDIVADVFGVDADLLRQPTRGRARIALARQVAMYIAHIGYGLTLTEVGIVFERDRTTVAHACAVVEMRRDDREFDEGVVLLEQIIRAISGTARPHVAVAPPANRRLDQMTV